MNKRLVVSVIIALLLIGVAVAFKSYQASPDTGSIKQQTFSIDEIKAANGKNGARCLVAVDNKVYEIEQGFKWVDGNHTASQGQAYCGADLSAVIDKAPHGRTKLSELKIVGTLK